MSAPRRTSTIPGTGVGATPSGAPPTAPVAGEPAAEAGPRFGLIGEMPPLGTGLLDGAAPAALGAAAAGAELSGWERLVTEVATTLSRRTSPPAMHARTGFMGSSIARRLQADGRRGALLARR